MQEFFIYIIKVVICTGVLCLYYYLFLRDKNIHQFNRYFLLFSVVAGLSIPLIRISLSWSNPGEHPPLYVQTLDAIQIGVTDSNAIDNIYAYLFATYAVISTAIIARLVISIRKIVRLRKKYLPQIIENIYLYDTEEKNAPFSFMNSIFWNRSINKYSAKGVQILRHEVYHVKEKHSLDLLFMEFAISLAWINPFFYLVRKELATVHEYLADRFAMSGADQHEYATLLVSNAIAQKQHNPIIHSFFHSQLKRRITMILQQSAAKGNTRFRRIMAFPLFVILFCCFAFRTSFPANNDSPSDLQVQLSDTVKDPSFKGGSAAWVEFLVKNMRYPKEAEEQKKQGNVIVRFTVNTDGSVSEETVQSDPGYGMGEEALRVIRLSTGQWEPATENGTAVKAQKSQPFVFRLDK